MKRSGFWRNDDPLQTWVTEVAAALAVAIATYCVQKYTTKATVLLP